MQISFEGIYGGSRKTEKDGKTKNSHTFMSGDKIIKAMVSGGAPPLALPPNSLCLVSLDSVSFIKQEFSDIFIVADQISAKKAA